jgi:hypothetical protein
MTTRTVSAPTKPRLFKRLGAGAFLFFALKGLLWLTVPVLAARFFR